MKSQSGLLLGIALLAVVPAAAAEQEQDPKPVPLGDVPEDETAASAEAEAAPADEPPASSNPDQESPAYFADRDNEEGIPTLRGTFALGGQLALASDELEPLTGEAGGGGRLGLGFAPARWPVLFGLSLDLVGYGSTDITIQTTGGTTFRAEIEQLSHMGQLFVRLQPDRYAVRPYLDLTAGYWMFIFNQGIINNQGESDIRTVGVGATGCLGVGVGVDWLFGFTKAWGNSGIGFDFRYTRGFSLPVPDFSTATLEQGELSVPGRVSLKNPHQLLFTLSLVVSSERGNWATSTGVKK